MVVTNNRLLNACRLEETDARPVWFMRQAGRYMHEYRELRKKHAMLEICKSPELSSSVAAMPVQKFGVDAAILFSDIMTPLIEMGIRLSIVDEVGPVIEHPIRTKADLDTFSFLEPSSFGYVLDSIRRTRELLSDSVPVIGFSGAPFTLASYLIEGRGSRDYANVKRMMYTRPEVWKALMERLTEAVTDYLLGQAAAGCQVVQLFDSWVGTLSDMDYRQFVLPYMSRITGRVGSSGTHVISFSTGNSNLLPLMKCEGVSVISPDWRIGIDEAWNAVGGDVAIQGNLDPAALLADTEFMISRARDVLNRTRGRRGHIFNLGHGIMRDTPEENVKALVDFVHGEGD